MSALSEIFPHPLTGGQVFLAHLGGVAMKEEEKIQKLKKMVDQLIKVEEEVINLTEKTADQAVNSTVKHLLRAIQHDSRKHADLGRAALEILEYKQVAGAEERQEVWDLLKKHADMERNHKDFLSEMKKLTSTPALQYIFEQIWNDEKIHHSMLETMMTKRFEKDPAKYWGALLGS
jgi:rubrerythrin